MESVIINGIKKSYNGLQALDDVTLSVQKGELFGFIGPDGAGKTTLFRILTTLLIPDAGIASVEGFDVVKDFRKIRQIVGYMPGRFSLYQDLSVEENLRFFASIFKTTVEENYHLIKDIYSQIEPFKTRPAGKLSGGMKQKLALSCALIHKPVVLFLDEPTTGVDAVSRKEFWEMLKKLQQQDITILVSTPYMDEASLCDRVALIQGGKIMNIDSPLGIIEQFGKRLTGVTADNMYTLLDDLLAYEFTVTAYRFGDSIHITIKDDRTGPEDIRYYLKEKGYTGIKAEYISPSVEDCFMALMNKA